MSASSRSRRALPILLTVAVLLSAAWVVAQTTATETPRISADDMLERVSRGEAIAILDVRRPDEFAAGHVSGAINIPHTELEARLEEIAALGDVEVVLYCRSGRRAEVAATTLREAGYERLLHLDGDMLGWQARQLPLVTVPETDGER